ncbi:uncharacterized protein LOC120904940 isoform X1 [Anopheles arabiensis]|uniref:uncharacterized protein LOC120904940 isoform X1 n=1 Tax=Anopheles arabiensis TaxID=7173 RepID=UPI001AAE1356|nr:uncharacterized protein LOC120904940 isoform X1 [Anopheles arabiensis]
MEKYVTVVSVDDQLLSPIVPPPIDPVVIVASSGTSADRAVELSNLNGLTKVANGCTEQQLMAQQQQDEPLDDSQFVTVLSINHGQHGRQQSAPEVVLVYRLPGERLGFGLKFQGGTKSNEKIQRLFIQSCAENSPASRVQASWGHLREGDEILEIDGVSVCRMTRIECVKCLKDSNVAIKLLVRNGEGKVQNFYGGDAMGVMGGGVSSSENGGVGGGAGGGGGEIPERKGAPPPPPPVPPRKLNKRKQATVEQQNASSAADASAGPPSKQGPGTAQANSGPASTEPPPPDAESYSNLFAADDISDLISESDDTASTISTVVDKFSICSSLSSEDYTIPSHGGPAGIGQSAELAKALKPFTLLEQEFNLESSKFETTNLFTFKPPPAANGSNVVQLEVLAEKPAVPVVAGGEYENVTIMKVDENRNYENVTVPYGPYENVTIQTVQPYENMVLNRGAVAGRPRQQSGSEPASPPATTEPSSGVYENVELKAQTVAAVVVPPRPLPRQGAVVEPKKRAPIPVPIPIVVPPPRLKPAKPAQNGSGGAQQQPTSVEPSPAVNAPLGSEFNTVQSWLQEATEVIHECALTERGEEAPAEEKAPPPVEAVAKQPPAATDLPRLIDFHPKVSVPLKALEEEMEAIAAPPASPVRFDGGGEQLSQALVEGDELVSGGSGGGRFELPPSEAVVRKCIKILSSEDHTYIESSSSDEEEEERRYGRSEDEDDRTSSSLSREATTPEQFLSGDGYSDEDGEKLGPPEIVSGGPSEAYFNFPWTSNLLPPIGEVEEEFSSLEHQHNGPIVIINTAEETVINDTNNNQQRERKKPLIDDEPPPPMLPHSSVPSTKIVITGHRIEAMMSAGEIIGNDRNQMAEAGESEDSVNGDQVPVMDEGEEEEEEDQDAVDSDDSLEVDSGTIERRSDNGMKKLQQVESRMVQPDEGEQRTESDEKVNNNTVADKKVPADPVLIPVSGGEIEPTSTCVDGSVTPHVNGGVETSHQVPEVIDGPMEQQPSAGTAGEMEQMQMETVDEPSSDAGSVPAKSANETTASGELEAVDADNSVSNIDAFCGDVDIVVGDTVESDFEELVKAQVEPLDVEDSSEQIQQIHERIIVGIERAVSEEEMEVEEGDVKVLPDPLENGDVSAEVKTLVDPPSDDGDGDVVVESVATPVAPAAEEQEQRGDAVVVEDEKETKQEPGTEIHPTEQESGHIASSGLATGIVDSSSEGLTVFANNNNNNNAKNHSVTDADSDKSSTAAAAAPGSVTSMDSMNNVVTTTTTVTAIASTVHQLVPSAAPSAAAAAPTAPTNGGKVVAAAPPAFSRLPPDGHEFPPNFTEPTTTTTTTANGNSNSGVNGPAAVGPVTAMTIMNGAGVTVVAAPPVLAKSNDKHSSFNDDLPDLPKSHPPPVPRKVTTAANAGDTFRKPPPFPTRSSSIAESMLSRKELPQAYQSLQSVFEQRRRSVDVPDHNGKGAAPSLPPSGRISLVGSNWRKDEKSEKSVRDKIAMFSSAADAEGGVAPAPQQHAATTTAANPAALLTASRKFSKDFTKSSENLLGSSARDTGSRKALEAIETYATLRKKAHSVEHLDEVDRGVAASTAPVANETPYKAKFSLETSKPVVLGKAYSVENLNPANRSSDTVLKPSTNGIENGSKILSRTTSFSGYSNGNSLATIASSPAASVGGSTNSLTALQNNTPAASDERWKSSISSLLEQRKKSMSKLRGLVIPEKVPEAEVLPETRIIGLPIIKSKDSEIILSSAKPPSAVTDAYSRRTSTLPMPPKTSLSSLTASTIVARSVAAIEPELPAFRKPLVVPPLPPAKPPRTSLVYPPKSGSTDCLRSTEDDDESDDGSDESDSVLSSRVSSPPVSPVAPAAPVEKYALTRTLSSETNTSITSSNSTLTSSSGSQASCSSVGSTPTVDISRKLSKSSSSEASMNRKNVLASAKSRNGRGDLKIEDVVGNGKSKRYEDGDSTDGYEEEERRKSKSKPRSSLTNGKGASYEQERKELTHYKVVDSVDGSSIVDKVIKVASYVEVVSDLEDSSIVEEPIVASSTVAVPVVTEKLPAEKKISHENGGSMSDLAKWVRHEAARTISHKPEAESNSKTGTPTVGKIVGALGARGERKQQPPPPTPPRTVPPPPTEPVPVPVRRELRSSVETKKLNLAEIRKSFESKSANSTIIPTPGKQPVMKEQQHHHAAPPATTPPTAPSVAAVPAPQTAVVAPPATPPVHATPKTTTNNGHDRFSSWDSLASSSSGVSSLQTNSLGMGRGAPNCTGSSQTLQSTPSDYGSFSSLGSSHSLITPQDLQLIIEEADPPLATPEAFVVVLQRETPESSIGITLAGGSDYEAKEITIHKILTNSPADRDGRLRKGDRILSINGLSMRGLTHRESLSVLKTPRPEVVMVITRSKSLVLDTLTKLKRPSMGSLSSLAEKSEIATEYERKLKIQHKASRSLDLDHLDVASNEAESVFDGTASEDGLLSADDVSKCSSSNATDNASSYSTAEVPEGCRMVEINKDGAGLGFSIEGGYDSPAGNKPLIIKKIFMGGAAEKSGLLRAGEEIVAINDISIAKMTRIQVWNMMKKLPNGGVRITLK